MKAIIIIWGLIVAAIIFMAVTDEKGMTQRHLVQVEHTVYGLAVIGNDTVQYAAAAFDTNTVWPLYERYHVIGYGRILNSNINCWLYTNNTTEWMREQKLIP